MAVGAAAGLAAASVAKTRSRGSALAKGQVAAVRWASVL